MRVIRVTFAITAGDCCTRLEPEVRIRAETERSHRFGLFFRRE